MTDQEQTGRITGTVKWFQSARGYGFITADGGEDVFVHASEVPLGLLLGKGDEVTFELAADDRGRSKAVNLIRTQARPPLRCAFGDAGEEQTDG